MILDPPVWSQHLSSAVRGTLSAHLGVSDGCVTKLQNLNDFFMTFKCFVGIFPKDYKLAKTQDRNNIPASIVRRNSKYVSEDDSRPTQATKTEPSTGENNTTPNLLWESQHREQKLTGGTVKQ